MDKKGRQREKERLNERRDIKLEKRRGGKAKRERERD